MQIGYIDQNHIKGKDHKTNFIDGIIECAWNELPDYLLTEHITVAVFRDIVWNDAFTTSEYVRDICSGRINRWKCKLNVERVELFGMDFDSGVTHKEIAEHLKEYAFIIAASVSHLKDKGDGVKERFHVFMPLDRPITNVNYYDALGDAMVSKYKFLADTSVLEPSRYFHKHKEILLVNEGRLLESKIGEDEYRHQEWIRNLRRPPPSLTIKANDPLKTYYWKNTCLPALTQSGGRHRGLLRAAGFLKMCGLTRIEAINIISSETTIKEMGEIEKCVDWAYNN